MEISQTLELIIRLAAASLIGAAIGFERKYRAKGAGIGTHVLVAIGSALFMVVSQYGFAGAARFDAARVAAGVVSGIGFLGGGIILKQQNRVSGLTTAAGLWVTSAMGLAVGSGMYVVGVSAAVIVLACIIFSVFASSPPAINTSEPAATVVWTYLGELIFNMLVLVGSVKMSDRVVREMLGL